MTDIATLGFAVDTNPLKKASLALDKLAVSGKKTDTSMVGLSSSIDSASSSTKLMGVAMSALGVAMSANKFVKYADEMTQLDSKLKLVTASSKDLAKVQSELFKISQNARVSFADTADLYSRMGRSTKETTISQEELLKVTDTISKSLIISGSSAESANAALVQLGQGFAADALRGQELNSVLEQTPRLAKAIAEGLGVGLGELREIAAEGQLTTKKTIEAILKSGEAVDEEFKKMTMTVDQSMIKVNNSFLKLVGNLNDATGLTNGLANSFSDLSGALDESEEDIKAWGRYTYVTLDRTMDGFVLLYEVAENSAQNAVSGIASLTYGTIAPITKMLRIATEGLNNIGFSSDENLMNALKLEISMYDMANKAQQDIKSNTKEITDQLHKYNVTTEERYHLLIKEESERKKATESLKEKNEAEEKALELTKEQLKARKLLIDLEREFQADWRESEGEDKLAKWEAETEASKAFYDLTTSETDKINDKFLALNETFSGLFDDEKMAKFYKAWQDEIDKTNKEAESYEGVGSKAWTAGLKGQSKALANIGNGIQDIAKEQKNWAKFSKENEVTEADKATHVDNQIAGYANLAGAMSSSFEEGSSAAEAFGTVQKGLSLILAGNAMLTAWQTPFPMTIPAVATAAMNIAAILSSIGTSSSATSAPSTPSKGSIKASEATTFSELNQVTTNYGAVEFDSFKEGLDSATEALEEFGNVGSVIGESTAAIDAQIAEKISSIETMQTISTLNNPLLIAEYQRQLAELEEERLDILTDTLSDSLDFTRFSVEELDSMIPTDFNIDSYNNVLDEVNLLALKAKQGIETQLDIDRLSDLTAIGGMWQIGQDWEEAIEILNDLNEASKENIKTWSDSFKTEQELVDDMASSFGLTIVDTFTDLGINFNKLATDIDGLTDKELEFLQANLSIIDDSLSSFESVASSLQGTIDNLRSSTVDTTYELDKYYSSMAKTKALSGGDFDVYAESIKETQSLSNILYNVDAFGGIERDMLFAQSVAANQFEAMQVDVVTQIDVLKEQRDLLIVQNEKLNEIAVELQTSNEISSESLDVQSFTLDETQQQVGA